MGGEGEGHNFPCTRLIFSPPVAKPNAKLRLPRGRLRSLLGKLPRRQTVAQCVLHGAVQRHACEGGGVLGVHPGGTGGTSHPPAVQHGGVSRLAKRRLWERELLGCV